MPIPPPASSAPSRLKWGTPIPWPKKMWPSSPCHPRLPGTHPGCFRRRGKALVLNPRATHGSSRQSREAPPPAPGGEMVISKYEARERSSWWVPSARARQTGKACGKASSACGRVSSACGRAMSARTALLFPSRPEYSTLRPSMARSLQSGCRSKRALLGACTPTCGGLANNP